MAFGAYDNVNILLQQYITIPSVAKSFHMSKTSVIISKVDLFQVFGLGFPAIPVVALIGILITSSLKIVL